MEEQEFKLLEYIDDKGKEQTLSLKCNTPNILIRGDELDEILSLEKRMLQTLSSSNGKEVDLIVIDDSFILPENFFSDLEFHDVRRILEKEAIENIKTGPFMAFSDRYEALFESESRNFTDYKEKGKGHMRLLVYFLPSISEDQKLHKALGRNAISIMVGVHFIAGINFRPEKPQLFNGCETRFSFPSENKYNDMNFFCKYEVELPKSGELWFLSGCNNDVMAIELKRSY